MTLSRLPALSSLTIACTFVLACASSDERSATRTEEALPERISDATPALIEPTLDLAEAPTPKEQTPPAKDPQPKPLSEEAKKKIEEYKALALKNDCSKGFKNLDGTWKFVGETRTPKYSGTLIVKGTRFKEIMTGEPDGKYLAAELEGEVRCVFKNRVLIQVDTVKPDGAYGNHAGDIYPCDLLSDMDPKVDRMLMICYFDWDLRTAAGLEYEFERVEP